MAYTSTDLENLERAAIALATGARVASVSLADQDRVDRGDPAAAALLHLRGERAGSAGNFIDQAQLLPRSDEQGVMMSTLPKLVDQYGKPLRMESYGVSPAFEGASTSRRMSTWGLSGAGPNDVSQ